MPLEEPGAHHPPPADLAGRDLPIHTADAPLFRFHPVGQDALYFGVNPPRRHGQRFDPPDGTEYGVLYTTGDPYGAFIETFGHNTGMRYVAEGDLAVRRLAQVELSHALRLVDLTGPRLAQLAQLGADARLFAGEFGVARLWSRAFYRHLSAPDGIRYRSRHDPERTCVALYDRAVSAIARVVDLGTLADYANRQLLADILRTYGFGYGTTGAG